jgi:hypothetical protein
VVKVTKKKVNGKVKRYYKIRWNHLCTGHKRNYWVSATTNRWSANGSRGVLLDWTTAPEYTVPMKKWHDGRIRSVRGAYFQVYPGSFCEGTTIPVSPVVRLP